MKRRTVNRKILRVLSLALVFAMVFSTLGTSGWQVLANELEPQEEAVEEAVLVEAAETEQEPAPETVPTEETGEEPASEEEAALEETEEEPIPEEEALPEEIEEEAAPEEEAEPAVEEAAEEDTEPVEEPAEEEPAKEDAAPLVLEAAEQISEVYEEVVPIVYPAQSFHDTTDDLSVTARVGEGVFPAGTQMRLTPVHPNVLIHAANESGEANVSSAVAVDIVFVFEGEEIQPEGDVQVTLVARKALKGDTHQAVTMDNAGNVEPVGEASPTRSTFDTDHFTVYGIVGTEYNNGEVETKARYTYEFYAGTPGTDPSGWAKVDTQIVIFGEDVKEPKLPAAGDGYYFAGWETEDGEPLSFTDGLLNGVVPEDASEDKLIKAYAQYYDRVFYVFFHTKEKGSDDDAIHLTREGKAGEQIDVDDVKLTSVEAPNAFGGWLNEDGDSVTGSVTIDAEDIHLYPDIRPGVTVTFHANEGQFGLGEDAKETYDVIVPRGFTMDAPKGASLPTCTGYQFGGWYKEAACETSYDFDASVEEEFTLYAKWTPVEMSYILRVYRENYDNDEYTIYSPEVRDGVKTGDPVPVAAIIDEYKNKKNTEGYEYFHLNGTGVSRPGFEDDRPAIEVYDKSENLLAAFDSNGNCVDGKEEDAVIAGDGSTIVRVNFSRDSFVLKFVFRYSDWVESERRTYKYVADNKGTFYSNNGPYDYGTTLKAGLKQAESAKNNGGATSLAGTERIIKYGQSLYQAAYENNPKIQGFFENPDWWFNAMFRSAEGQTRFDTSNMDFKLKDFDPRNGSGQTAKDGDTLFCVIRWTTNQKTYPIRDIYYLSDVVDPENINKAVTPDDPNFISYNMGHSHTFIIGKIGGGYKLADVTNYDPENSVIRASGENKYYFKWDAEKGEYEEIVCHWVPTDREIIFVQEAQHDLVLSPESKVAVDPRIEHPYGTGDLEILITEKLNDLKNETESGDKWTAVTDTHGVAWAYDGYRVTYADDGTVVENLGEEKLERDLKVTLLWKPETYVVYYDPDDGSGDKTKTDVKAYGRAKSWKDLKEGNGTVPQKEGYIFTGWTAYEPEGEGDNVTAGEKVLQKSFDFGTAITRNYYLKASWTPVSGYSVRYDAVMYDETDGTHTEKVKGAFAGEVQYHDDPATYRDDVSVPVTAVQPEAEGYRFLGWRLPDGSICRGGSFTLEADKCDSDGRYVLTAVYGEEKGTSVTYHARYPGVNEDNNAAIPHDVINGDFTVAEPDATDIAFRRVYVSNGSAYRFKTWTTDENAPVVGMADGYDYFDPNEIAAAGRENNHLYAVWEVIVGETPKTPPTPPTPPTPTPDPDPDTPGDEIPDEDVPLSSGDPHEGGSSHETFEEDAFVAENDTPLTCFDEEEELNEEDLPLTPFTGDDRHTDVWLALSILSLAGIALLGRKKREIN